MAGATAAAVCDIHVWLLLVRSRHRRRCVKMAEMHGKDLKRRDANMWSSHSTTFAMAATTASVPVASVLVSSATNHASLHARRRWRRWKHTAVTPTTPRGAAVVESPRPATLAPATTLAPSLSAVDVQEHTFLSICNHSLPLQR